MSEQGIGIEKLSAAFKINPVISDLSENDDFIIGGASENKTFYIVFDKEYPNFEETVGYKQINTIAAYENCKQIALITFKPTEFYDNNDLRKIQTFFNDGTNCLPLAIVAPTEKMDDIEELCGWKKNYKDSYYKYSNKDADGLYKIVSLLTPILLLPIAQDNTLMIEKNTSHSFASYYKKKKKWR